jgi:hypothetical protein
MFRDVEEIIRRQIKVPFIKINEIPFLILRISFPVQFIYFVPFLTDVSTFLYLRVHVFIMLSYIFVYM